MYGIQGEPHYTRQRREDIRTEVFRSRSLKRAGSGVFGAFARELTLDAGRLAAIVIPQRGRQKRRKQRKKGTS